MIRVLDNGDLVPYLIREENLALIRKHYAPCINSSVTRYCFMLGEERPIVQSEIDEIVLQCVRKWNVEKCNSCRFLSFLITAIRRRMEGHLLRNKNRQKRDPSKAVSIHNILAVDHNLRWITSSPGEEKTTAGEDNFKGPDRDPLDILIVKECVVYLKTKTTKTMQSMVRVIEKCISNPRLNCADDRTVFKVVRRQLKMKKGIFHHYRNKLKKEALAFIQN